MAMKIRVSVGTAVVLGLEKARLDAKPTTAYLMLYHEGRCLANCAFCPQARSAKPGRADMLSRIIWPAYRLGDVLGALEEGRARGLKRACVQALLYPRFTHDLLSVVEALASSCDLPISVSCQPLPMDAMRALKRAGAERLSVPVDAATPELFEAVKGRGVNGPYRWEGHMRALEKALSIFGPGFVGTHIIIGLGETEREAVRFIQAMYDKGVYVGLFALTPIRGTALQDAPRPSIGAYRRIQMARYLIAEGLTRYERMSFDGSGRIRAFGVSEDVLLDVARSGEPFMTSGCPDCNRPYYNESPRGPLYNFPYRPSGAEVEEALAQLWAL